MTAAVGVTGDIYDMRTYSMTPEALMEQNLETPENRKWKILETLPE